MSKWSVDEVRVKGWVVDTLEGPDQVRALYPPWSYYGWDGSTPLHKFIEPKFITEIKFKGYDHIFRFEWGELLLTDKGSVPDFIPDSIADDGGWLWQLISYYIHDGLYASQLLPRKDADLILRSLLEFAGLGGWDRYKIYYSVRLGGWFKYNKPPDILDDIRKHGFHLLEWDKFKLNVNTIDTRVCTWKERKTSIANSKKGK